MSGITDTLLRLDPTLVLHNEGEWNGNVLPYSAFNSGGIECETGEYFYGMIRMMRPKNILETGTHLGIGASYMGLALKDNGEGHLDTVEFLKENHSVASARIEKMGLSSFVTCYYGDVKDFAASVKYQFILLDTEPDIRFREFLQFYPFLDDGGVLFIHDLGRGLQQKQEANGQPFGWPFGIMPDAMKDILKSGAVRPFHFPVARGLSGFYKVHPEDYKL